MGSTFGMKLALVLFMVALSVPTACFALMDSVWYDDGHVTFYGSPNGQGTQGGACAYQDTIKLGYGTMTAALSTALFQGGLGCGSCYEIKCKLIKETKTTKNWCHDYSKSIVVTATNLCPPGSEGTWCNPPRRHFDLPMPAFLTLAKREGGVAPVLYRRVPCQRKGGIRFTMGGNPFFFMILIHNVGGAGDIIAVQIKCSTTPWTPMYRNWGSLWTVRKKLTGPLSFRITTGDGRTYTVNNGVGSGWTFGQTWEGSQIG